MKQKCAHLINKWKHKTLKETFMYFDEISKKKGNHVVSKEEKIIRQNMALLTKKYERYLNILEELDECVVTYSVLQYDLRKELYKNIRKIKKEHAHSSPITISY